MRWAFFSVLDTTALLRIVLLVHSEHRDPSETVITQAPASARTSARGSVSSHLLSASQRTVPPLRPPLCQLIPERMCVIVLHRPAW